MLTVYLDQNKWIDLARADSGHSQGDQFVDVLAALQDAVNEGRVQFPLSAAHYYETGKQRDPKRRLALAGTMMRLAGLLRIAPPHVIVPWEIRRALVTVFGLPAREPETVLWGSGVAHALAAPSLRYIAPVEWNGIPIPSAMRAELQRRVDIEYETVILAGATPESMPDERRVVLNNFKNLTDDRFVQGQQTVAENIVKLGRRRLEDVMLATALADIVDPLMSVAADLGVSFDEIVDRRQDVIDAIPSRWVEMKLRHQRQANPQKQWEGNDLNDVTALAIAVPYCNVTVTERSWSSMLAAARVPARFGHVVVPKLQDLVDLLRADS